MPSLSVSFMDYASGFANKNSLTNPRLSKFCPMFSSRSFIVLHIIFRSATHFDLIFMNCVRSMSVFFFFFACGCPVIPVPLIVEAIFSPFYCLCSFVKDQLTLFMQVYIWALSSIPFVQYLVNNHTVYIIVVLQYCLKLSGVSLPTLFFSPNILLAILAPSPLHVSVRIILSVSAN